MVDQFIAHPSPGRSRIFALIRDPADHVDAVTTLGTNNLHLTDDLVNHLNDFLLDGDEASLKEVLDRLPGPVRMAVNQFLRNRPAPELGAFTGIGPVDIVRAAVCFSRPDDELEDYLTSAYTIGLGIRVTNQRDGDGNVDWMVQLLSDEVSIPASAELRSWAVPDGVKVLSTWTSKNAVGGPVRGALEVASAASAEGHWVRMHSLLHSDQDVDFEGSGTSEFVVDSFDAPIPMEDLEE